MGVQKTKEKGAKEARETNRSSKENAGTVGSQATDQMTVLNLVEERAKAKAKARGKVPGWL